jgi:hypothetical protein
MHGDTMAQQLAHDLARAGLLEGAYTIGQFCEAFKISRGMFYKLKKLGKAPVVMEAGKPLISYSAAAEWRRAREAEAIAAVAA